VRSILGCVLYLMIANDYVSKVVLPVEYIKLMNRELEIF
jgi:hypothetical protein